MVNTREKGNRNERKVENELQDKGYETTRMPHTRFGDNDFFNLFDIIAMKPGEKIRGIQVKTNSASGINKFCDECLDRVPLDFMTAEMWVVMDYKGKRVHKLQPSEEKMTKTRDDRHD